MTTIIKSELESIKDKIRYYSQLNTDNNDKLKKITSTLLNYYTTSNTKKLTELTDELMMHNKTIIGNNEKYINIINRTISNYEDTAYKSKRNFESSGD